MGLTTNNCKCVWPTDVSQSEKFLFKVTIERHTAIIKYRNTLSSVKNNN